ncbi:MAG: Uma2 family endonuclease [Acidobacteria bacterium]|nr:Uma2 family endonuclease [Acidobacteriota bacterium]
MSQPAVAALDPLPFELVEDDGEPLETRWHYLQINLLVESIEQAMEERGRSDYFAGGNMFVYYSEEQAREVAEDVKAGINDPRHYRGPDVFYVGGVDGPTERKYWVVWEEAGRYPDLIVELLSPSTAKIDRTVKKDLYARTFRTSEYFYHDPDKVRLEGFRLAGSSYQPIALNARGRFWSERLGLELGLWQGVYRRHRATWVRLFHPDGRLVPTAKESADAERQQAKAEHRRAEAERQRADAAEAELARLRARLGEGS